MGLLISAVLAMCQGSNAELRQVNLFLTVLATSPKTNLDCARLGDGLVRSWFIRPGMNQEQVASVMGRKCTDTGGSMRKTTATYSGTGVSIDYKAEFTDTDQPKWTVTEVRWLSIPNTP
jgi:hypothetical protein